MFSVYFWWFRISVKKAEAQKESQVCLGMPTLLMGFVIFIYKVRFFSRNITYLTLSEDILN